MAEFKDSKKCKKCGKHYLNNIGCPYCKCKEFQLKMRKHNEKLDDMKMPEHPKCRCTDNLLILQPEEIEDLSWNEHLSFHDLDCQEHNLMWDICHGWTDSIGEENPEFVTESMEIFIHTFMDEETYLEDARRLVED